MFEASLAEKCPQCRTAQTDQASPQPEQPSTNHLNNKRKKRNTWIALAAVIGFIIILAAPFKTLQGESFDASFAKLTC
jgi:hypothetical protein